MAKFFLLLTMTGLLSAQPRVETFPTKPYFRQVFQKPRTEVELLPPVQLAEKILETMADGKPVKQLELNLRSYLELVMANNTDVAIQRLNVETYKNAITRAFSAFDPVILARITSGKTNSPVTSVLDSFGTTSSQTIANVSRPASFNYSQTLQEGLQINTNYTGQRSTTTSANSLFNPLISSNLGVNLTQPLLRNRGYYINRIPILIARSRLKQSVFSVKSSVIGLVQNAESAYWDAILARDNLRVQQEALRLATEALARAQQELDLGAMSPLDIYNPQQNKATAEISVSQARFTLTQREDVLRRQIGADLSPDIRVLPIKLTETVEMAIDPPAVDTEAAVERALGARPDLKGVVEAMVQDDFQIKAAVNNLRPDLSLLASYAAYGRGGNFLTNTAGFGESLNELFAFSYPTYSFGVQLRFPVRNHSAVADYADQLVGKKTDALTVRTTQQQIRLDILNAASQVESAKSSVALAKTALDFAHKYLDAEQKKYELGTSTIYFVLQAQQSLINADFAVVQNTVSYRRNLLNLAAKSGTLLEDRGIALQ